MGANPSPEAVLTDTPSRAVTGRAAAAGGRLLSASILVILVLATVLANRYVLYSSNANVELPPILSMLEADLYANDFHVQEMRGATPRMYFNWLVYLPAKVGLGVPATLLCLYLASLAAFIAALVRIGERLCGSPLAGGVLAWLGLVAVWNGTIGYHALFWRSPYPYVLGMGLVAWGVYWSLAGRWVRGWLLLGLGALLQFLVGVLPALLLLPFLALEVRAGRVSRRTAASAIGLLTLFAAAVYLPMRLSGGTGTGLLGNEEFVALYAFFRHPHHLVASSWPLARWLAYLAFVLASLLAIRRSPVDRRLQKALQFMVVGSVAAVLVNYLFVEVVPLALVAKLQLARATPFGQLAGLVGIAAWAGGMVRVGGWGLATLICLAAAVGWGGFWLLGVVVVASILSSRGLLSSRAVNLTSVFVGSTLIVWQWLYRVPESRLEPIDRIALVPLLGVVFLLPGLRAWLARDRTRRVAVVLTATVLAGGFALGAGGRLPTPLQPRFEDRIRFDAMPRGPLTRLATAFSRTSPTDAVVLVPPSAESWRLFSRRAVVVDAKSIPYTDRGLVEWRDRLQAVLGPPPASSVGWTRLDAMFRRRTGEELAAVARRYGAAFVLTHDGWHSELPGRVEARRGPWVLWRLHSATE